MQQGAVIRLPSPGSGGPGFGSTLTGTSVPVRVRMLTVAE
jgi:hypothetical protein